MERIDDSSIIFIGDIHQQWASVERGLAALPHQPRSAILLGDIECNHPLDRVAAPLLDRGIAVHWIFGNHDGDGGPEMWANLVDPARNPRTAPGALNARVRQVGGLRIAGLGGIFRPRIWEPPAPPRVRARPDLLHDLAKLGSAWRKEHLATMAHAIGSTAIWPEDYDALATQRADVLVTHEAPGSHPSGYGAIDALARAMGARLIVHGHHHVTYRAVAADGLCVMGVAAAWATGVDGAVMWQGEQPRRLPPPSEGWAFETACADC